jgi:DNA segregation ATPase FtsK/SpoIIIE, S-DNA-T family
LSDPASARTAAGQAADKSDTLLQRLSKAPRMSRFTNAKARLEEAIADGQARVAKASAALQEADTEREAVAGTAGRAIAEALRHREAQQVARKKHRIEGLVDELIQASFHDLPMHLLGAFAKARHVGFTLDQSGRWKDWTPSEQPMGVTVAGSPGLQFRWGTYDPSAETPLMFSLLPLIGGGRPWVILSDDDSTEAAHGLLHALTLRLALTLPQQSRFTFLDPLGFGQTFPMQRFLPAVRETTGDMATDLQRIQADIRRIARDVVAFHGSFEKLPADLQAAERYEFILAADFPKAKAYDRRVADMLFDVGRAGPRAGRYLILHLNQDAELPYGLSLRDLGDAWTISLTGDRAAIADTPPSPQVQQELLERLRSVGPARRGAALADVLPARNLWWTGGASRRIETPLDARKDGIRLTFGQLDDETELVHAVLAAAAGSGKSNLLHALLLGLAARYSPDELRLYLMDLKQGVELQPYSALPHAAVVAYNTDPALARAVLAELRQEMTRRLQAFRAGGYQKPEDYRNAGEPLGPAPRVLLVIDEYQVLFQGADAQEVSADLLALSTQGRAAGIHMLLGSQTFRAVGMQGSEQIFNNINIRMAMRMPAATAQAMVEFEREGKDLIRACDLPGKVVINTGGGRDGSNKLGQVVLVEADDRRHVLGELDRLAATWPAEKRANWPSTQVFDGSRAPALAAHGLGAAAAGTPLDRTRLAQWAATPKHLGGQGQTDWREADCPVPLVLGREYAVHGEAAAILRRLPNQNLLIIGPSAPARLGMLSGLIASIAALAPEVASLRVLDLSRDPAVGTELARAGDRITVLTDPAAAVATIEAPPAHDTELLLLIEPDRAPDLLRPTDPLARAAGPDALERRLREGPLAGRHTLLVTAGAAGLGRVLGRRGVNLFAWRAATQMSQDDSQDILGNRLAAGLRNEAFGGPEAALLADMDGDRFVRFMPYGD